MIRLSLVSVGMVEDTGSVIVVMRAAETSRLLVMEVGLLEGRAIALEAEGIRAPRPLTHDLMHSVIERLGARVSAVQIRDFRDKVFYADLMLEQTDGTTLHMDARPSDAIAIALRAGAPIFASEAVLDEAGIEEDDSEGEEEPEGEEPEEEQTEEEPEDDDSVVH